MRISDWSSDVCSSDLVLVNRRCLQTVITDSLHSCKLSLVRGNSDEGSMAATQVRQWKHTTLTRAGHERNASLLQTTPECVHVEVFRWLELPAVPVADRKSVV